MAISTAPTATIFDPSVLQDIADGNLRMTSEQAMQLYQDMPLPELGRWADKRCRAYMAIISAPTSSTETLITQIYAPQNVLSAHFVEMVTKMMHTHSNTMCFYKRYK